MESGLNSDSLQMKIELEPVEQVYSEGQKSECWLVHSLESGLESKPL